MCKTLKISLITFLLIFSNCLSTENKIILKINNDIITTIDVLNEIKSLKFFYKNLNQLNNDDIYKIAIESISKYKIKKDEINRNFSDIKFENENYLNQLIEKTYRDLGFQNLKNFEDEMMKNKISFERFKEKLKTDIIWNQIIYTKYFDKLVIDEKKLKKQIDNSNKIVNSLNLREIVYEVTELESIETKYNLIQKDIKEFGFESAAAKHSISNSSNQGGNLGWIDENAISNEILIQLKKTPVKSITSPIRIASGFLILQKFDEKEVQKQINIEEELKNLIDYEKNQQLNNYSNLYYNKIKKNVKIDAP